MMFDPFPWVWGGVILPHKFGKERYLSIFDQLGSRPVRSVGIPSIPQGRAVFNVIKNSRSPLSSCFDPDYCGRSDRGANEDQNSHPCGVCCQLQSSPAAQGSDSRGSICGSQSSAQESDSRPRNKALSTQWLWRVRDSCTWTQSVVVTSCCLVGL